MSTANVVAAVASLLASPILKAERINRPPTAIEKRSLNLRE